MPAAPVLELPGIKQLHSNALGDIHVQYAKSGGRVFSRAATSSRMLDYKCTSAVDNYSSTISRTWIFGRKKKKILSRQTLTRARESGGRWHGTVGKNVSQLKHCQTHHSETGTKCPDFCLDSEENGLFCHLWFLKQHCLLLLLLLNQRLQLQLEVKLHAFSATELGYCSKGMVVATTKKNQQNFLNKKKYFFFKIMASEYSSIRL